MTITIRTANTLENCNIITTTVLKKLLKRAKKNLGELSVMQERQCLPSFSSRKERMEEISLKKVEINKNITDIESRVSEIELYKINHTMKTNMQNHFFLILQSFVLSYRSLQQEFLKKVNCMEIFDKLEDETCPIMITQNKLELDEIQDSIFNLTTTLIELKVALGKQTQKIDRIEFYFTQINSDLRNANAEIAVMPSKTLHLKNKIIFTLTVLVSALSTISLIKIHSARKFSA